MSKDGEHEHRHEQPTPQLHPFQVPSKSTALDELENMSVVTSAGDTVHGGESLAMIGARNDSVASAVAGSNKVSRKRFPRLGDAW